MRVRRVNDWALFGTAGHSVIIVVIGIVVIIIGTGAALLGCGNTSCAVWGKFDAYLQSGVTFPVVAIGAVGCGIGIIALLVGIFSDTVCIYRRKTRAQNDGKISNKSNEQSHKHTPQKEVIHRSESTKQQSFTHLR